MTRTTVDPHTTLRAAEFGAEVRQLRKARQMTLTDLARDSGVSVSHISAIERGAVNPSLDKISRIAGALGVPEDWFFYHRAGRSEMEQTYVVREQNRRQLDLLYGELPEVTGYRDTLLSSSIGGAFYMGQSEYLPNTEGLLTHTFSRDGELHGVLIDGELELVLGDERMTLRAGDSFSFPGRIFHSIANRSDAPARLIWVNSPVIIPRLVDHWASEQISDDETTSGDVIKKGGIT